MSAFRARLFLTRIFLPDDSFQLGVLHLRGTDSQLLYTETGQRKKQERSGKPFFPVAGVLLPQPVGYHFAESVARETQMRFPVMF